MTLPLHTRSGAPGVLRGRRNVGPSCCRTALPSEVAAVVDPECCCCWFGCVSPPCSWERQCVLMPVAVVLFAHKLNLGAT